MTFIIVQKRPLIIWDDALSVGQNLLSNLGVVLGEENYSLQVSDDVKDVVSFSDLNNKKISAFKKQVDNTRRQHTEEVRDILSHFDEIRRRETALPEYVVQLLSALPSHKTTGTRDRLHAVIQYAYQRETELMTKQLGLALSTKKQLIDLGADLNTTLDLSEIARYNLLAEQTSAHETNDESDSNLNQRESLEETLDRKIVLIKAEREKNIHLRQAVKELSDLLSELNSISMPEGYDAEKFRGLDKTSSKHTVVVAKGTKNFEWDSGKEFDTNVKELLRNYVLNSSLRRDASRLDSANLVLKRIFELRNTEKDMLQRNIATLELIYQEKEKISSHGLFGIQSQLYAIYGEAERRFREYGDKQRTDLAKMISANENIKRLLEESKKAVAKLQKNMVGMPEDESSDTLLRSEPPYDDRQSLAQTELSQKEELELSEKTLQGIMTENSKLASEFEILSLKVNLKSREWGYEKLFNEHNDHDAAGRVRLIESVQSFLNLLKRFLGLAASGVDSRVNVSVQDDSQGDLKAK